MVIAEEVFERFDSCDACNKKNLDFPCCNSTSFVVDYALAIELGGKDEWGNVWLLCKSCHKEKKKLYNKVIAFRKKEVRLLRK